MRENIELGRYKLYVSRHDRVVTVANHENMSLFIVLEGALRSEEKFFYLSWPSAHAVCEGKMLSFFYVHHSASFPTRVLIGCPLSVRDWRLFRS